MDYVEIIKIVLIVALGAISYYLKTYTNVNSKIAEFIKMAEEMYLGVSGAGESKMAWCIEQLNKYIPVCLKPVLTDEVLRTLIQNVFDQIKAYSDIQKQKLADKINEKLN